MRMSRVVAFASVFIASAASAADQAQAPLDKVLTVTQSNPAAGMGDIFSFVLQNAEARANGTLVQDNEEKRAVIEGKPTAGAEVVRGLLLDNAEKRANWQAMSILAPDKSPNGGDIQTFVLDSAEQGNGGVGNTANDAGQTPRPANGGGFGVTRISPPRIDRPQ